jgi:hypothetical protein
MEIKIGNERIFCLRPALTMEQAREKAWDKKTSVFGGLKKIFNRPKSEEIQITYSEFRYEPFWHVACNVHYDYDRMRSYNIKIPDLEVQCVTIEGKDYPVTTDPRQFTIKGVEHCIENDSKDVIIDAMSGQEKKDWEKYLGADKELVSDLSQISTDENIIVMPEKRASAVVRQVLTSLLRSIEADTIYEEKADVNIVDLYFRPVYAFEYKWEPNNSKKGSETAVAEFDGLTGAMTSGGVTLRKQVDDVMTRDFLFDLTAEAANLLVPGGGIAVKVTKYMVDSHTGSGKK